ncbi:MAG: hypothetical protein METHP_01239 [Methanoregula sp. SKADARSKE-2]|jgi:molybdopterin synthase sulfur carrier subunit|nr:MAG: hypothetical protein METHP_01239 [Methanoregula sp. SKADARSKE-2]
MSVKIRFFARFRELLGTEVTAEAVPGTHLASLIQDTARKNKEG